MDTRVLIAIILSLVAVFAYQELVLKRLYPPPREQQAARQPAPAATSTAAQMPTPATGTQRLAETTRALPSGPAAAERTVEVETDLFDAVFTTRGARLKSFRLKRFHETAVRQSPLLEMVKPAEGGDLPLGLVLVRSGVASNDRGLAYETGAPAKIRVAKGEHQTVVFTARTADGQTLVKSFSFEDGSYVFGMRAEIGGQVSGLEAAGVAMSQPLGAHAGYLDIPEAQADVNNKTITEGEKALRKGVQPLSGTITYAGFGDRYFLSAFLPQKPAEGVLQMDFDGTEATTRILFPAQGRELSLSAAIYVGPKQLDILEAANPRLSKAIDFGWSGILALAFLRALKLFHHIAPNYGIDIILLTVAIRVLFLPMSIKSQRSMMRLQRLQPQVERMREKFKDDKERLNREMMDLYRRNHVNPLGGCAPMLLQLPIFIGLYAALLNAVELRHAPFIGWITDLSAPDCLPVPHMPVLPFTECAGIPVLVLLMGLSTFVQQWMSPQAADPNQQRMMMLTPIIFTIMLVKFPAGLSLYYFASNVLGILQQFFLNREFRQPSPATA